MGVVQGLCVSVKTKHPGANHKRLVSGVFICKINRDY